MKGALPIVVGVALGLAAVMWALQDPASPEVPSTAPTRSAHRAPIDRARPAALPRLSGPSRRLRGTDSADREAPDAPSAPPSVVDGVHTPLPEGLAPVPQIDPAEYPEAVQAPSPDGGIPDAGRPSANLRPEDIKDAISKAVPQVTKCYEQVLEKSPAAAGTLVAQFTLVHKDGAGSFDAAEIVSNGLDNPFLGMCVLKALAELEFPAPEGGNGTVVVKYPFRLAPSPPEDEEEEEE